MYVIEGMERTRGYPPHDDNGPGGATMDVVSRLSEALVETPRFRAPAAASYAGWLLGLKSVHSFTDSCAFVKCSDDAPRCGTRGATDDDVDRV